MLILAIETSCDETSAAIVENGTNVRSNVIATSRDAFERSGGVIPEQAARKQIESIMPVIHEALGEANMLPEDIDLLAVTKGPGLLGSLLVGTTAARTIASVWQKPLIGVHHTFGHLSSPWLLSSSQPSFPILTLSASGGHTDLWYRTDHTKGALLGQTRDDAAGEAFDKGASLLGLPYPGGPAVAKLAEHGKKDAYVFPSPLANEDTLTFSFSGLKTALRYLLRDIVDSQEADGLSHEILANVAASFQHAIAEHLCSRIERALKKFRDVRELHIVGGVSANLHLRMLAEDLASAGGIQLRVPSSISYCTDNAAMIGAAAYFLQREDPETAFSSFETTASLPLENAMITTRH